MAKGKEYSHVDAIGRPLKVGDPVAVAEGGRSGGSTLFIGTIVAMGEKKIRVVKFGEPTKSPNWKGEMKVNGSLRYPENSVLLDGPDITMYLLKLQ